MCRHIFSILLILIFIVTTEANGNYRYDYLYNKQAKGWLKFHQMPATFKDAFLRCKLEGAVLVSPLNTDIQKAMVEMQETLKVKCGIFTGIHATISKGDFTSVEGIPLSKIPVTWAPNEPDNFENQEDCIIMLQSGAVADVKCNDTYPYACYRTKTNPLITACGTVDAGYKLDSRTGSCYKFQPIGQTWRRAQMTCLAEGGHLAIINSATELLVIQEIFAKYPAASIHSVHRDNIELGFLDWDKNGSWYTVNGQSLEEAGFADWLSKKPSVLANGRHCGSLYRSGQLDDIWCDGVPFAFICEKTPNSLKITYGQSLEEAGFTNWLNGKPSNLEAGRHCSALTAAYWMTYNAKYPLLSFAS